MISLQKLLGRLTSTDQHNRGKAIMENKNLIHTRLKSDESLRSSDDFILNSAAIAHAKKSFNVRISGNGAGFSHVFEPENDLIEGYKRVILTGTIASEDSQGHIVHVRACSIDLLDAHASRQLIQDIWNENAIRTNPADGSTYFYPDGSVFIEEAALTSES